MSKEVNEKASHLEKDAGPFFFGKVLNPVLVRFSARQLTAFSPPDEN
jgi:hypothetical protein